MYVALIRGVVKENEATIDMPIGRSDKDRKKMAVRKSGKNAVTHFKILQRFDGFTYLEIKIDTGRTHQIRVHLSEIGYPVVGDEVYSNGKNPFGVKRSNVTCKVYRIHSSYHKGKNENRSTCSRIFWKNNKKVKWR